MKTSEFITIILGFIVFSALLVLEIYFIMFVDTDPFLLFIDWLWSVLSLFFIIDGIRRIKND